MQKPLVVLDQLHRNLNARLQAYPTHVDARNLRALSWAAQGDLDAARDDLVEALRLRPGYQEALINLVWLHTRRNEPGAYRAILQSRRVQDLSPAKRIHLELVGLQRWDGLRAAQERWSQLDLEMRQHPWLALDGLWLAVMQRDAVQLSAALKLLHEHHCEWTWHLNQVGSPAPNKHAKQALEVWAACYEGNPGIAKLLSAQLPLVNTGRQEAKVEGVLHWATLVSADLCGYWLQIGAHHDRYLRNEEAEEAYRKAIVVGPERAEARLSLGHLYSALGCAEEAVVELEIARKLQPEWPDVRYLLGLLYEELGLQDKALAEYHAATICNPRYPLPNVARGKLLASLGRTAEALESLEAVRKQGLESVDLDTTLAELHEELGHNAAARAARQRAAELSQSFD